MILLKHTCYQLINIVTHMPKYKRIFSPTVMGKAAAKTINDFHLALTNPHMTLFLHISRGSVVRSSIASISKNGLSKARGALIVHH